MIPISIGCNFLRLRSNTTTQQHNDLGALSSAKQNKENTQSTLHNTAHTKHNNTTYIHYVNNPRYYHRMRASSKRFASSRPDDVQENLEDNHNKSVQNTAVWFRKKHRS
eukprot:TRINITY_DN3637_c0_g1_i3.p1 TRINITY_DN3637_c0_g1~~TRINITY_DN3637_c0_g1_i3.p1  ORF type:complete len:109 (-),score=19.28 TRINITY_DN3637_c0_g1_i3:92-418(-)